MCQDVRSHCGWIGSIAKGSLQALVIAEQNAEEHLRKIAECTCGVLFLGTPHHGSDLAEWADQLTRSVGLLAKTNKSIIKALRRDSEVLARIQDGFQNMVRRRDGTPLPIEVTCCFEELEMPGVGLVSFLSLTYPIGIP